VSRRVDRRLVAIPFAVLAVGLGGWIISNSQVETRVSTTEETLPGGHDMLDDAMSRQAHQSFQQAVVMLQGGQFEHAITALHEVLEVYPALPEAHVNMGFALLGLGENEAAIDFFHSATDLRPSLHNAYYGLALAELDAGNDKAALAAMQAFAHRASADDRHLPRAQALIWELQEKTREASP
jgi:tetratricopeptide (TPR) repeat protein